MRLRGAKTWIGFANPTVFSGTGSVRCGGDTVTSKHRVEPFAFDKVEELQGGTRPAAPRRSLTSAR